MTKTPTQLNTGIAANFEPFAARRALDDPRALFAAFVWAGTPQGHEFWADQYNANELSPEARGILETWIAEASNG